MKRPRFFALLTGLLIPLLTGGCVMSEQPLSARKDARPDPRLVGAWHPVDAKDATKNFHVTFDAAGIGKCTGEGQVSGGKLPETQYFFVTPGAKASYLNVFVPADQQRPEKAKYYEFFKYTVSKDGKSFRVWSLQLAPFQRAVQASVLKGELVKGDGKSSGGQDNVLLRDSSANILRFLEALPDQEAFTDLNTFRKVR